MDTTRARILATTTQLLAQGGPEAATTRAICEAAGLSAPTLYHHFQDKEALVSAAVQAAFEAFLVDKMAVLDHPDPVENLRRHWDNYVQFGREHPDLYALMYSRARPAARSEAAHQADLHLIELLGRVGLVGRLRLELELAAQLFASGAHGVTSHLVLRPDVPWNPGLSDVMRDTLIGALTWPPHEAGGRLDQADLDALLRRYGAQENET